MLIFMLLATMFTANDLKQYCASTNTNELSYCNGYLLGFDEGVRSGAIVAAILADPTDDKAALALSNQTDQRARGCSSDGVTMEQVRLIFLKYIDEHPEKLHVSAALIVSKSL